MFDPWKDPWNGLGIYKENPTQDDLDPNPTLANLTPHNIGSFLANLEKAAQQNEIERKAARKAKRWWNRL